MAQMVKNLPAMLETQVRSLGWEDPLEKETAIHSSILPMERGAWGGYSPWGHKRVIHNLVTKQQQCKVGDTMNDTMAVSSKVNILLPYHPAMAILGIYPKELKIYSK